MENFYLTFGAHCLISHCRGRRPRTFQNREARRLGLGGPPLFGRQTSLSRGCTGLAWLVGLGGILAGLIGTDPAAAEANTQSTAPLPPTSGALAAASTRTTPDAEATAAALEGDTTRTRFRLTLDKGVTAEIYTLANPYRVIIDLPHVVFRLDEQAGRSGAGLVKAFRYGLFAEGKARVVLDAAGPVRIEAAAIAPIHGTRGPQVLDLALVPIAAEDFGAGTGSARASHTPPKRAEPTEHAVKKSSSSRPVVVIDAGHGGIDGGAVGLDGQIEKTIVFAVAREVERELKGRGKVDVRMTRSSDVFLSLDRRLDFSREAGADLFISLHADILGEMQYAGAIRGATVYTLSSKASNEEARRMAEKENASDLLAGIDTGNDQDGDDVKGILIDLMKRETANFSRDFSNILTPKLARTIPLSKDSQRSAAFKVLKQTHAPSVLVELGYLSHPEDLRLLTSPAWQKKAAHAVAEAIEAYFAKHAAQAP